MSQPEARIGNAIRKFLEQSGVPYFGFKVHGSPAMMSGLPDLVCCINGRFVGIEFKQPGQKASAVQELRHKQIRKAGGVAIVADCVADVQQLLNDLDNDA